MAMKVGTDCSGIEAPIQALKNLDVDYEHIFCSDINPHVIKAIKANYSPNIIFGDPCGQFKCGDITQRNIEDVPDIDLYVAGFPCQPFSDAGNGDGFSDPRGNVFWSCLEVIRTKQPNMFVLENVQGLLTHDKARRNDKYGRTWSTIWMHLEALSEFGYNVQWKKLNTKDYGIPHSRPRVFMVGTKGEFEWPDEVPSPPLLDYVDVSDTSRNELSETVQPYVDRMNPRAVYYNLGFRHYKHTSSHLYAPCICASDASKYWNNHMHRKANCKELLMLQGFPPDFVYTSQAQLKKQLGNSISVCTIQKIIRNLIDGAAM